MLFYATIAPTIVISRRIAYLIPVDTVNPSHAVTNRTTAPDSLMTTEIQGEEVEEEEVLKVEAMEEGQRIVVDEENVEVVEHAEVVVAEATSIIL